MKTAHSSTRNTSGQNTLELAGVLAMLVVAIVPIISLGIIPLRFELARRAVGVVVHKLSLCDKFSDAVHDAEKGDDIKNALKGIGGVHLLSTELVLSITSQKLANQGKTVDRQGRIPVDWLPDGRLSPCTYFLHLKVHTTVDPLITATVAGQSIPGVNKALSLTVEEVAHWENLGRDPATSEFYVNE
jgi:hypothetical protein